MTPLTAVSLAAGAIVSGGAFACLHHATYGVRSQWLGTTEWRGRTDTSAVAITFDDGPTHDTEGVLAALAARNVPAAFFLIGRQVERHPDLAGRVAAAGHEIGNHSYSHPIYLYRTPRETHRQLARAQEIIAETCGIRPTLARPPCGVRTPAYFRAARQLGLRTVQWTVAGFDWQGRPAADIARLVLRDVSAGAIILLHDGGTAGRRDRRETVAALPAILDGLHERRLAVVPLRQLLAHRSVL
jgi:peptidoglycan-N-acetylglucosamine deacetylase